MVEQNEEIQQQRAVSGSYNSGHKHTHMRVTAQTYTPHAGGGHKEKQRGLAGKDKA